MPNNLRSMGHIVTAINIPLHDLAAAVREGRLDSYKKSAVALYDDGAGGRAMYSALKLVKVFRFKKVYQVGHAPRRIARGASRRLLGIGLDTLVMAFSLRKVPLISDQ